MGQLRVHIGPYQSFYYFESRLNETSAEENLWILPVNRAARIFKKRLVDASPQGALLAPPVFTFDELLLQIYQQLPSALRVINSDMLFFFVEDILFRKKEAFRFFTPNGDPSPGLVSKVGQMVDELRRFGYSGKTFSALQFESRDEAKSRDFELLLRELETRLGAEYIDESFARHSAAIEVNEALFRRLFPRVTAMFISGYGLFTPAMYGFIEKVSRWLTVEIKIEYDERNEALFRHTASAVARFKQMGAQIIHPSSLSVLSEYLFNHLKRPPEAVATDKRLEIYGLQNREAEVEFIAGKILQLHRRQKISLQHIGVTFANLERYVPMLRRIFREYDIPFNLSTGFHLKQSPLIRLFLRVIKMVAGGFETEQSLQLLRSSFLNSQSDWDYDAVYRLLIPYRVLRLTPGWEKALANIPELENSAGNSQAAHYRQQLNLLQTYLAPFYDLPKAGSAADFREKIMQLWKNTGLLDWFKKPAPQLSEEQQENEFRAFNRFIKLFDKMFWMLDKIYGTEKITLGFIVKSLQSMINQTVYNLKEVPDYGVQVMPRLEIQAVPTRMLIVGGMTDGEFPRASTADIFFNDILREQMGLVASEELLDQDRFLFYTLLDSANETIILTHPRFEEERALVPSTFLHDLRETVQIQLDQILPEEEAPQNKTKLWLEFGLALQRRKYGQAGELMNLIRISDEAGTSQLKELLRRMQAAALRFIPGKFSHFEGWLAGREELKKELRERYGDKSWSASRLEQYAFCPMSFFLGSVLQVEDLPQPEDEISALERGSLIHRILFRFYSRLRDEKQAAFPARHGALLARIAEEELAHLPLEGFFLQLEKLRLLGTEQKMGLLQTFVEKEQKTIEQNGFAPAFLELAFGQGGQAKDPASSPAPAVFDIDGQTLKLNGRIDRVDKNANGDAHIWDYKSGTSLSKIKVQEILSGFHLQLPLYLLALQKVRPELHPQLAGYFFVKDAANCERKALLADGSRDLPAEYHRAALPHKSLLDDDGRPLGFDDLLQRILKETSRLVARIQEGAFHHTFFPENEACQKYCPFKRICQKEKGKLKKMAQELNEVQSV